MFLTKNWPSNWPSNHQLTTKPPTDHQTTNWPPNHQLTIKPPTDHQTTNWPSNHQLTTFTEFVSPQWCHLQTISRCTHLDGDQMDLHSSNGNKISTTTIQVSVIAWLWRHLQTHVSFIDFNQGGQSSDASDSNNQPPLPPQTTGDPCPHPRIIYLIFIFSQMKMGHTLHLFHLKIPTLNLPSGMWRHQHARFP